jgi:hypothetical protein
MDACEFNLTIRSFANFFKTHKSIGLVVLDGLHYIENLEYLYLQEKRAMHENAKKEQAGHNLTTLAEEIGDDIPSMDDFFGDQTNKKKESVD